MFRLAPVFLTAALVMTTPALAQTTTPDATPQGKRLTCSQPLPALDLGTRQKPGKEKTEATCACIWEKLSKADQDYAEGMKAGTSDSSDSVKMDNFSNNFGNALESCWQ